MRYYINKTGFFYGWDRYGIFFNAVQEMRDVLLVPAKAVTKKDGVTYVKVVLDDGTVVNRSFIAGGGDSNYYWVIDGLTEGMKLCWE